MPPAALTYICFAFLYQSHLAALQRKIEILKTYMYREIFFFLLFSNNWFNNDVNLFFYNFPIEHRAAGQFHKHLINKISTFCMRMQKMETTRLTLMTQRVLSVFWVVFTIPDILVSSWTFNITICAKNRQLYTLSSTYSSGPAVSALLFSVCPSVSFSSTNQNPRIRFSQIIVQTLSPASPTTLGASASLALLLDLYKRAERKVWWAA